MRIFYTPNFQKNFKHFPQKIEQKFEKQIDYLLRNFRYPSLNVKKFDRSRGIWQARVDRNIRFYFQIKDDIYVLLDIRNHPK